MGESEREFSFTDEDFEFIRNRVYEHAGIVLSELKRDMVYSRLARRVRQHRLASFRDYCRLLNQSEGQAEFGHFINALTTNLTAFFREPHHFEYLADTLLPELMRTGQRQLRIWSAGCSVGEEAYSIAMTVREVLPDSEPWDVRILATDIDTNVLAVGQAGVYRRERLEGLDAERLRRWFWKGTGRNAGLVKVKPELRQMVRFRALNLVQPWPLNGPFDVIFCRNVMIYFDKPTQRRLLAQMADILRPQGHLFIGHSESLYRVSERFRSVGKTLYRKVD